MIGVLILLFIWNPIPATGKPLGILVFTVLALFGTYILVQQTAREFPDTRSGSATNAIRTRVASMRERPHRSGGSSAPPGPTTAEQLKQLADLRDSGAISPDEYQSAKSKVLNG